MQYYHSIANILNNLIMRVTLHLRKLTVLLWLTYPTLKFNIAN